MADTSGSKVKKGSTKKTTAAKKRKGKKRNPLSQVAPSTPGVDAPF